MHLGRVNVLPAELRNELVQESITTEQRYFGLRSHDISA